MNSITPNSGKSFGQRIVEGLTTWLSTGTTESSSALRAEDAVYVSDAKSALLLYGVNRRSRVVLRMVALFVLTFLVWATFAPLDEVTRGTGKVIPSSHVQVIQNLEGGILTELKVAEGDFVEKGQELAKLDDIRFSSSYKESRIKYLELLAKTARLQAEIEGKAFDVPKEVKDEQPSLAQNEISLYQSRQSELKSSISVLEEQVRQKSHELSEFEAKRAATSRSLELINKEVNMSTPLLDQGAISEVEILRLRRQANELSGEAQRYGLSIPRVQSELQEGKHKIEELKQKFKAEAAAQLNEAKAEMARTSASNEALEDRVTRTRVVSPVKGTVKQIKVTTIGGVIQPGMELMEIVPLEDQLLIEAEIRPKDVAFLHPGLEATVKFTAYDFSIYGGLKAKLEHISADTITKSSEEKGSKSGNSGEESFYLIRLRTDKNHLGPDHKPLAIIPGMTAEADIITGKKTVMDYLLKPVLKARDRALRER
jgi:adhesin transport system membrane fusion protein